ncbi:PLC-like phosphodiesterase [Parachaetomium inaequale]|uniref:PLC-like phosphodiesterase n=1 Tax=Parachaetomium inaequale TaxID=2588326 RepID=A0AAN6PQZ8_9PEZI|nr:PLC-like phosphodiesterase [Parachaetomium inaequale]
MARLPPRALTALLSLTPRVLASPQDRAMTTTATQPAPSTAAAPVPCNNSPDLCSRAYNNITHMGAHDSAFLRDASTSNSVAGNQYYNATIALSAGIRLLQAQVHLSSNNTLELCHTDCRILDAGPLEAWLARIKHWLDANPNDVVTLLLVNSDNQPASSFGTVFDRSGISTYAYTPPSSSGSNQNTITWPTLQALITANTRLITFIASLPSPTTSDYPYLLNEFNHVFETPYNTTSPSSFTCALDRGGNSTSVQTAISAGMLPLLNHFVYLELTPDIWIPAASAVDATNSPSETEVGALGRHLRDCMGEWGNNARVVFVLVDFYDRGPAVGAADRVNGVGEAVGRVREPAVASSRAVRVRGRRRFFGGGAEVVVGVLLGMGWATVVFQERVGVGYWVCLFFAVLGDYLDMEGGREA